MYFADPNLETNLDLAPRALLIAHTVKGEEWICAMLPPTSICTNPFACRFYGGTFKGYMLYFERRAFPRLER